MTCHHPLTADATMLIRPKLLAQTAQIGAGLYRRARDLPGAVAGLAGCSDAVIVARLRQAEQQHEDLRRARAPQYRAARHIQVLAALLAEQAPRRMAA